MEEIVGTVVSTNDSPSTTKFYFVIEKEVKKGQYVQVKLKNSLLFGYIGEIISGNRYFERVESVAEYEKNNALEKHFPIHEWEYKLGEVKILGLYENEKFKRAFFPPSPGKKVSIADEEILKKFLGLDENGLCLGTIQHHSLKAKINLTRLLQKHFAILAMSGAGKSYLTTVIIEELLKRKKDQGRVAVIVIDLHGEYYGFGKGLFSNKTTIFNAKKMKIPLRKVSAERFLEWFDLSYPQYNLLNKTLYELNEKLKNEKELFGMDELIENIEKRKDVKKDTIEALKRVLIEVKNLRFISTEEEKPVLTEEIKPGKLLVLDFSEIDYMKKKQILVSLIARRLFNLRKKNKIPPFLLIVEEAHNFARENAKSKEAIARSIIETIAREGRKFGASLSLITQRPVNLSTTALSQCNTHILLRITNPNDLDHIQKSSEGIDYRVAKTITGLRPGECVIVGEAVNAPIFVDVRKITIKREEKNKKLEEIAKLYEENENEKEEEFEAFLD